KPDGVEDMIALVARFRPGPLPAGRVEGFISREQGCEPISCRHPDYQYAGLEPVLKPTYGIILYQEQVMQIAQVMGGYTLGGADLLRRAMGKKIAEEMARERPKFEAGAKANGVSPEKAREVFDLLEKFANYGFTTSHAAAY